jgi:predicted transcriptional regulator
MSETKTEDRHLDPPMRTYHLRLEVESFNAIRLIAQKKDRTRQSILREAIRFYLARKGKA